MPSRKEAVNIRDKQFLIFSDECLTTSGEISYMSLTFLVLFDEFCTSAGGVSLTKKLWLLGYFR